MSNFPMIEVRDLEKYYGKQVVLNKVKLQFKAGQFVALVGKNGSGKSTLMRMISQRELWSEGGIYYQNQSFRSPRVPFLSDMVFITEDQNLPIHKDIFWWKTQYSSLTNRYRHEDFDYLVKHLNVDISKKFSELSRGQKMKALFCLQAPRSPNVYLLDEITSVLDSGSRWILMDYLQKEAQRGALIIMSTNIAGEMQGFANQVCVLDSGNLELVSAASELGDHFEKYRVPAENKTEIDDLEKMGARKVMKNSDGAWSLLRKKTDEPSNKRTDRREISIEDVAAYYTISGSLK